jgi:hypothetical protein
MRSRLIAKAVGAAALSLFALTSWAVQTGVQISGVNPGDIASGTISFGNQPAQALVSRDDCESRKKDDENCDRAFLWFATSSSAPAIGTAVKVTLTDRKGNTTTGTGTVTENGVRVSVPAFPGAQSPRTASAGVPGFRLNVGYDEQMLPAESGGLGIRFTPGSPGSERFILVSPDDFEGESAGIRVSTPFGPTFMSRRTYLGLMAYFGNWDIDESAVFAAGTESRGWAYQVESAPGGSTGIGFPGTVPLDLTLRHKIEEWGFGFDFMTEPSEKGLSYGLGVRYSQFDQDIEQTVTSPTFTGANFIGAEMTQGVRDRFLMLPLTIRRSWNPGRNLTPYVQGMIAPGYYDSDLSGSFLSTCNLCPADQLALLQLMDDSDSGFTWGAGVGGGIDFRFGNGFLFGVYGGYGYRDHLSFADNRESPLDDPPSLGDDSADYWRVGLSFGYEFRD